MTRRRLRPGFRTLGITYLTGLSSLLLGRDTAPLGGRGQPIRPLANLFIDQIGMYRVRPRA